MKLLILEIEDCSKCPYCRYFDHYDGYRVEDIGREPPKEGFYCTNMHHRFIAEYYNNNNGNTLNIPIWCKLKDAQT